MNMVEFGNGQGNAWMENAEIMPRACGGSSALKQELRIQQPC